MPFQKKYHIFLEMCKPNFYKNALSKKKICIFYNFLKVFCAYYSYKINLTDYSY